ncbi:serine/threonine-protein kinase fused [Anopheles aquasalis]|uniref:serine/threonine-protein kinase fused n=1 Tax=Anopheles aquasalis TaxID=42839 RepID=UPI00215AC8D6|nr:serine/threonine-protein kinase fused [Anopheles aquasalis]XP_050083622.1 serine/threonine-protein kinase fused [Anopheles aquasalis]
MEKYAISNLIGEGSFGRVYKAVDKSTKVTVAVKIINKRGRSGREIRGLRGECEIQRSLLHPHIIRMLDSYETPNEIVVVTEYAKMDLHSLLRGGSLGEQKTQRITFDLVSAMYYLHSHRILHRDLKPQNILLDRNMSAKLCDFGFARNMTIGTHVLTSIKGTPLYMAPELLEAKPYDHHADLWSLGCIIYEMLAGEPPFSSTSMIHLVRLIRTQHIKWPSFLTSNCVSFVQGLLERDPAQRMSWSAILMHAFVKGHIFIIGEHTPFNTHPLTVSQTQIPNDENKHNRAACEELSTSRDSINVILQSDVEYQETDCEDSIANNHAEQSSINTISPIHHESSTGGHIVRSSAFQRRADDPDDSLAPGSINSNLLVNRFNDNFPLTPLLQPSPIDGLRMKACSFMSAGGKDYLLHIDQQSQELERRKLNQSIDNFSIRIESEKQSRAQSLAQSKGAITDHGKLADKSTPCLLPGWDSCDDSQNPPIENEEWLVFLQRSMQEILDGELDSLRQRNFVCIIVAPLRNCKASAKVIEHVAHLLSLPLAIDIPPTLQRDITHVYGELKLVPNLVYASKLLCNRTKTSSDIIIGSQHSMHQSTNSFRQLEALDNDEVKTLTAVYDLISYLTHIDDVFLNQFCDAIEILGAKELFISFFTIVHKNNHYTRLVCSILALLNCALRELPENAEIIEQIIFDENVNIIGLLQYNDSVLRLRTCMMLRVLARFSCLALQTNGWTNALKESLETLCADDNIAVKMEATLAIEEFKYLSLAVPETL